MLPCHFERFGLYRLGGNWVSALLYRRCLSSIVDDFFALSSLPGEHHDNADLLPLIRKVAQELALLSVFAPFMFSNIGVDFSNTLRASDSSSTKGAIVTTSIPSSLSRVLWEGADKKGAYTKLETPVRCLSKELFQETEIFEDVPAGPFKAPIMVFDFIEFYGGAGVISHHMKDLGFTVAPPLDLSASGHYNMSSLRLLEWAIHMVEDGRLKSWMVEPPCTSFSAAAHPCVRSYKLPLGFCRKEWKTFVGNLHAFRAFVMMKLGVRKRRPCGLAQPRWSKMAWTHFWRTLLMLGCEEAIIASCQFGSIRKKEFRFLLHLVLAAGLEKKCPGGHPHVKIEGGYTKPSAVYTDGLGRHVALGFAKALDRAAWEEEDESFEPGFESPLTNDILSSLEWFSERVWTWKKNAHVNVHETEAAVSLISQQSKEEPHSRFVRAVDSSVALHALAKGRSSSYRLQPALKRSAAVQIAFDTYPAGLFAPTCSM